MIIAVIIISVLIGSLLVLSGLVKDHPANGLHREDNNHVVYTANGPIVNGTLQRNFRK